MLFSYLRQYQTALYHSALRSRQSRHQCSAQDVIPSACHCRRVGCPIQIALLNGRGQQLSPFSVTPCGVADHKWRLGSMQICHCVIHRCQASLHHGGIVPNSGQHWAAMLSQHVTQCINGGLTQLARSTNAEQSGSLAAHVTPLLSWGLRQENLQLSLRQPAYRESFDQP